MSKKKDLRQARIRQILLEESRIRITDLAKRLEVTPETLRSDLNEMEAHSLLIREHGYARIHNPMQETPLFFRNQENAEAKKRVAIQAFNEIDEYAKDITDPDTFLKNYDILFLYIRLSGFRKHRFVRTSCLADEEKFNYRDQFTAPSPTMCRLPF